MPFYRDVPQKIKATVLNQELKIEGLRQALAKEENALFGMIAFSTHEDKSRVCEYMDRHNLTSLDVLKALRKIVSERKKLAKEEAKKHGQNKDAVMPECG